MNRFSRSTWNKPVGMALYSTSQQKNTIRMPGFMLKHFRRRYTLWTIINKKISEEKTEAGCRLIIVKRL